MPSPTDLYNDALGLVADKTVTNPGDGSPQANFANRFYLGLRQASLRARDWNFATGRAELAQLPGAAVYDWTYRFQQPPECLKVRELNGPEEPDPFEIEDRLLLTNVSTAKITYTKDVTDLNKWDGMFYQAMTFGLAAKLAIPLAGVKIGRALFTDYFKAYRELLMDASQVDGQEGSRKAFHIPELTSVRNE